MGLWPAEIGIIVDAVRNLPRPFRVLSLGHPDILATPEDLAPIVGATLPRDSADVENSRGASRVEGVIGNARILFDHLGAELTVIDGRQLYGVDRAVDLNQPLPADLRESFDLVIDGGTCEHIFDVAMALKNVASAAWLGGLVYHMSPLVNPNHGFWSFNPVVYAQFYSAENGFDLLKLAGFQRGVWFNVEPTGKFTLDRMKLKAG